MFGFLQASASSPELHSEAPFDRFDAEAVYSPIPGKVGAGWPFCGPAHTQRLHEKRGFCYTTTACQQRGCLFSLALHVQVQEGTALSKFGTYVASTHSFDTAAFGLSINEVGPGSKRMAHCCICTVQQKPLLSGPEACSWSYASSVTQHLP